MNECLRCGLSLCFGDTEMASIIATESSAAPRDERPGHRVPSASLPPQRLKDEFIALSLRSVYFHYSARVFEGYAFTGSVPGVILQSTRNASVCGLQTIKLTSKLSATTNLMNMFTLTQFWQWKQHLETVQLQGFLGSRDDPIS